LFQNVPVLLECLGDFRVNRLGHIRLSAAKSRPTAQK
jgi:hypothetical protein